MSSDIGPSPAGRLPPDADSDASEAPNPPQRRLRVLSIAPTSFFSDYGCHVRILEEARALQSLGHDVAVLTYFKGGDVPGLRIIRTRPTPWHADYEVGSSRHKYAFDALLSLRLLRVLTRERFDILHAHLHEGALIAGVLAKPWRIPVCFDYQGSLTDEMAQHGFMRRDRAFAFRFWRRVELLGNRLPDAVFTSTQRAADELRAELPKKPIFALPDSVNTDVFQPGILDSDERARLRLSLGIDPSDTVVVYLGLLARHQGIEHILTAAEVLHARGCRLRWLVMGYPGMEQWRAAALARGVQHDVIFTGRVPYANAPRMLALGDIAVAPKLSLTEGSGKVLNYMAMGLPTVAFDTPAQAEYLGDLGVYASSGDALQLAQRVEGLLDQPEKRIELGRQLRARAEQTFSWRRSGQTLVELYEQMLLRRRARRPAHPTRAAGPNPQHEL